MWGFLELCDNKPLKAKVSATCGQNEDLVHHVCLYNHRGEDVNSSLVSRSSALWFSPVITAEDDPSQLENLAPEQLDSLSVQHDDLGR